MDFNQCGPQDKYLRVGGVISHTHVHDIWSTMFNINFKTKGSANVPPFGGNTDFNANVS